MNRTKLFIDDSRFLQNHTYKSSKKQKDFAKKKCKNDINIVNKLNNFNNKFSLIPINNMFSTSEFNNNEAKIIKKDNPNMSCGPFGAVLMGLYFITLAYKNNIKNIICFTPGSEIVVLSHAFKDIIFHVINHNEKYDKRLKKIKNVIIYYKTKKIINNNIENNICKVVKNQKYLFVKNVKALLFLE